MTASDGTLHFRTRNMLCGEPNPTVAYFRTGGRVAKLHAALRRTLEAGGED